MVKIMDVPALAESHSFALAFCSFLDDFKRSGDKAALISEKPEKMGLKRREFCMLACAAHKIANDNGIAPPEWVHDKSFAMAKSVYAFDTKIAECQKFLRETSPEEYRLRNLFYGENVLMRV